MKGVRARTIIWGLVLLSLAVGVVSAAAQKPSGTPSPAKTAAKKNPVDPSKAPPASSADPVVLKVGDQQISKGDFDFMLSTLDQNGEQNLKAQGRKPFADQYVMILLLYKQAMADHVDAEPDVRRELAMSRLRTIAQAEYEHLAEQTPVTPEETEAFFKAHLQDLDERDIREVAVLRKQQGAAANAQGLDDAAARERVETIRKALASGTDPAKVVQDYALPNVVLIDAKPNRIRHGQLIASLDKPAFELKDGEISDIIETPQALVFLQVVGRHTPDLKEVTPEIENAIRQQKLATHMQQLRQGATVWMDDQYFKAPEAPRPSAPTATPPAPSATPQPPAKP
jgi:parvulin-like peptidyl-prolyl cis-trans isomerase-like protein